MTAPSLRVLYTAEQIHRRIGELADEIRPHLAGANPLLLAVLKGSFVFLADLARALAIPLEIDFVRLSSYGGGTEPAERVRFVQDTERTVRGRHVLVVEDIVDTGHTLRFLLDTLAEREAASVRVVSLLDKPDRRAVEAPIDFVGFTVPDVYVVGYGMDLAEAYRQLPDIRVVEKGGVSMATSTTQAALRLIDSLPEDVSLEEILGERSLPGHSRMSFPRP